MTANTRAMSFDVEPAVTWRRVERLPDDVLVADFHVGCDWVNLTVARQGRCQSFRMPFSFAMLPELRGLSGRTRDLRRARKVAVREDSKLIEPIVELAEGCSMIYLVPHGPLEHYPLHAVSAGGKTLLDMAPVVYLPYLGMLPEAPAAPPASWKALVMGNMTGDLPGAEREAEEVARRLGTEAHLGQAATLELLRSQVTGKNLLHIAGHGYFDPAAPLTSGIPFPDGILTVRHIHELGMQDCRVVLSGCVTGLGGDRPGEGFSSLLGACLAAGAPALLVSLWEVDDDDAQRFMVDFYDRANRGESTFSHALRESYLNLRDRSRTLRGNTDPYYWAAFKAVGRW